MIRVDLIHDTLAFVEVRPSLLEWFFVGTRRDDFFAVRQAALCGGVEWVRDALHDCFKRPVTVRVQRAIARAVKKQAAREWYQLGIIDRDEWERLQ